MKSPLHWFKRHKLSDQTDSRDSNDIARNSRGSSDQESPQFQLPTQLLWLLDAPLFIDARQVDAFYDAVLRPDYEGTSITLSSSITKETTFGGGTTVGAALP